MSARQDGIFKTANLLAGAVDFFEALDKGVPILDAAERAYTRGKKRAAGLEAAKPKKTKFYVQVCPCGSGVQADKCHEHIDVTPLFCGCGCGLPASQCKKVRGSGRVG